MTDIDLCPVCAVPFKAGDTCATDIELGECHADCLDGSPAVDLDTGDPSEGPITTYAYEPHSPALAAEQAAPVAVEAVAWRCIHRKTGAVELRNKPLADLPFNHKNWTWEPLYASPPAAQVADEPADFDSRMKAAGMIPLSDLLNGNTPLERWMAHTGVSDLDTFEEWLNMRNREFMTMRAGYELGDKDDKDELYEWVMAHSAAFSEVAANFRQMKKRAALASPAQEPQE